MWKEVRTESAPVPIAAFSQAADAEPFVFVSGQVGLDPESNEVPAGVEDETRLVLKNIEAILSQAGLSMADVVRTTVYMTDLKDYTSMNTAYEEFFTRPYPARATLGVADLLVGARVEIDAIAKRA